MRNEKLLAYDELPHPDTIDFTSWQSIYEHTAKALLYLADKVREDDKQNALARGGAGIAMINLGRYDEAIPHLEWCLLHDDKSYAHWVHYGYALMETGKNDAAIAAFDRAIEIGEGGDNE